MHHFKHYKNLSQFPTDFGKKQQSAVKGERQEIQSKWNLCMSMCFNMEGYILKHIKSQNINSYTYLRLPIKHRPTLILFWNIFQGLLSYSGGVFPSIYLLFYIEGHKLFEIEGKQKEKHIFWGSKENLLFYMYFLLLLYVFPSIIICISFYFKQKVLYVFPSISNRRFVCTSFYCYYQTVIE